MGSATTATTGRRPTTLRAAASEVAASAAGESQSRASALAPEKPNSSFTVAENTTVAMRGPPVASRRSRAATIAAMPPFTSQLPRPYIRPSRTTGANGSMVIFSTGTVSWWASQRMTGARGTVASSRAMTAMR